MPHTRCSGLGWTGPRVAQAGAGHPAHGRSQKDRLQRAFQPTSFCASDKGSNRSPTSRGVSPRARTAAAGSYAAHAGEAAGCAGPLPAGDASRVPSGGKNMTHISEENEKRETKERERTPVALLGEETRCFYSVRSAGGTAAANCHQHQVTAQSRGLGRRWGAAGGRHVPGTDGAAAAIPARAAGGARRGLGAARRGLRSSGCATGGFGRAKTKGSESRAAGSLQPREPPPEAGISQFRSRTGTAETGGTQLRRRPGGSRRTRGRRKHASAPPLTPGRSGPRRGHAGRGREQGPPQEPRAPQHRGAAQRGTTRYNARPPARPRGRQSARPPLGRSAHAPALPARRGQWAAGDAKRPL